MTSLSSGENKSCTSPDDNKSLTRTINFSLIIWFSVNINNIPLSSLKPVALYIFCKSSLNEFNL